MANVTVYGADWCSMTQGTLAHLKHRGVAFDYINIDKDRDAARWVAEKNNGREKKPTVDIGGEILTEPSNGQLDELLAAKGIA